MRTGVLLFLFAVLPIGANAATASDSSIEELLTLTRAEQAVTATFALVERQMQQAVQQSVSGKALSPEQRTTLDESVARFVETIRGEFTWAVVKPLYVQAYRETFDQAEVDGIVAFYKTAVGSAYSTRLPILSQKMTAATQGRLQQLLPRMREALRAALTEAKVQ